MAGSHYICQVTNKRVCSGGFLILVRQLGPTTSPSTQHLDCATCKSRAVPRSNAFSKNQQLVNAEPNFRFRFGQFSEPEPERSVRFGPVRVRTYLPNRT